MALFDKLDEMYIAIIRLIHFNLFLLSQYNSFNSKMDKRCGNINKIDRLNYISHLIRKKTAPMDILICFDFPLTAKQLKKLYKICTFLYPEGNYSNESIFTKFC